VTDIFENIFDCGCTFLERQGKKTKQLNILMNIAPNMKTNISTQIQKEEVQELI
jgi:hypothetical protein